MNSSGAFDYYTQSIPLITQAGVVNIPLAEIDEFNLYITQLSINYGAQIGGSVVMLIVLVLLTKPDKYRSTIFLVNLLSLVLNVINTVVNSIFCTSPFVEFYTRYGQDYSRVPRTAYANSITATVFDLLVLISIESALCLQMRVVLVTIRGIYQRVLLALSALISLVAIGFRTALTVENAIFIMKTLPEDSLAMLSSASNITTSISICWFCAVFVTKLGFALNQRRKLGMPRFGPMQIIFIMGCQTLIVPAIFSIIQYFVPVPLMATNSLTATAIFLPLSSLWASSSLDSKSNEQVNLEAKRQHQRYQQEKPRHTTNARDSTLTGEDDSGKHRIFPRGRNDNDTFASSNNNLSSCSATILSSSDGGYRSDAAISPTFGNMNLLTQHHAVAKDLEAQGV